MRNTGGVSERDMTIPALQLMKQRGGFISMPDLRQELERIFQPTGKDAEINPIRGDTYFSQKVRNIVSHKATAGNIIHDGYAEHVTNGIRITDAGVAHLASREL